MYRVSLPYTTRTTGVDIFDTDNIFRQRDVDTKIDFLNRDDGTFLKALDLWAMGSAATQAVYYWAEDDILPIATKVNYSSGYSATATSIVVDDSRLFVVNSEVHVPRTLENMLVTAVDYSTHTLTVTRSWNGTPGAALVDDDELIGGVAHLPELADANLGTGRIPTTEKFNYVSRFSESFKISHMQEVAAMFVIGAGKVASIQWEVVNKMFECKRKVNKALLFQHRGTTSVSDGTIYCSQGFIHYIQDNVLNLGDKNDNLTWPILSNFFDQMFDPIASSKEKLLLAGSWLYGGIVRMAREMATPPIKYFMPDLQEEMMEIMTENGNMVKVVRDRHGFSSEESLQGWGVIVDMAHVSKREYTNEPMTWRQGIQAAVSHFRQDEYWGSFSLELRHPDCHGFIRGAQKNIVE